MSTDEKVRSISLDAAADLSSSQYLGVTRDSNGRAALCTTLGQKGTGVLQNDPDALGKAAQVAQGGIAKCKAGAAVTAGTKATVMANGRFQTAGSGHHVWGEFTETGVDGQIVGIDLDSPAAGHILV